MEIRDFLGVIRHRIWLIVACALIVTGTAVAISLVQTPTYAAETDVLVSEQNAGAALLSGGAAASGPSDRYLQTQVSLIQLRSLLAKAIETAKLKTTPEKLLKRIEVTGNSESSLITIQVKDSSAARAALTANAIADTYVQWSREAKRQSIRDAAAAVEPRLVELQKSIETLRNKSVSTAEEAAHQAEIDATIARYSALAEQLEQLRINEQLEVGPASVVSRAHVDNEQISPKPLRNGVLALAVGLVLGVALAFAGDYLDNTISTAEDAEDLYGAPALASIPRDLTRKKGGPPLALVQDPGGFAAEEYRVLRNNLNFINFNHELKTILVTSPVPDEGKSTVAANLAIVLAKAGRNVTLVVTDFHRLASEQFFDVDPTAGLSDVLVGWETLDTAVQQVPGYDTLRMLTAGRLPPNPSELLSSPAMAAVIKELGEWADWIILDSAPVLALADTTAVAPLSDGVLVVVHAGTSKREYARKGRAQLEKVGARILGVVAWDLKVNTETRGHYGYSTPPE